MILGTFRDKRGGLDRHARSSARDDSEDEDDAGADGDSTGHGAGNKKLVGWAYVGSHNFTPSAWGTLSGTVARPILNVSVLPFRLIAPRSADTPEFLGLAFMR